VIVTLRCYNGEYGDSGLVLNGKTGLSKSLADGNILYWILKK
jgi:hypothetical protein